MRSPTTSPPAKYHRAPRAEWKIVHAAAAATALAAPTVTARDSGWPNVQRFDSRVRDGKEECVGDRGEHHGAQEIRRESAELEADHGAARARLERGASPAGEPRVPLAQLDERPAADPRGGERREHADGDRSGGMRSQRRGDRSADDGGRAPLRVARRTERQRVERDELERRRRPATR